MEKQILNILTHPAFEERSKLFYEKYNLKDILITGDSRYSKRSLKTSLKRTCIFCKRSNPETTFSNHSHLIPQLIGNPDLYSDFECDKCNAIFSTFENDLANFLGISRSISGLNGNKSRSYIGNNILIIAPEDFERVGKTTNIKYIKNAFIPSHVYKSLIKSALSIIGDNEVSLNYEHAIQYLQGNGEIREGAFISGYKLSFKLNLPLHVYFFEKKRNSEKIPTHIIVFHFQNNIISLPVPLHRNDICFYKNPYDIPIPPPYFTNQQSLENAMPSGFHRDLSSNESIINEEEIIKYSLDTEDLSNSCVYNPSIDEVTQNIYERGPIKFLIMTRDGVTVDPKTFSTFIKKQMESS